MSHHPELHQIFSQLRHSLPPLRVRRTLLQGELVLLLILELQVTLCSGNRDRGEAQDHKHEKHEDDDESVLSSENVDGARPQLDTDVDDVGDDENPESHEVREEVSGDHEA